MKTTCCVKKDKITLPQNHLKTKWRYTLRCTCMLHSHMYIYTKSKPLMLSHRDGIQIKVSPIFSWPERSAAEIQIILHNRLSVQLQLWSLPFHTAHRIYSHECSAKKTKMNEKMSKSIFRGIEGGHRFELKYIRCCKLYKFQVKIG